MAMNALQTVILAEVGHLKTVLAETREYLLKDHEDDCYVRQNGARV